MNAIDASLIREVLFTDPRPASQKETKTGFGISFWDVNVRWEVADGRCMVLHCEQISATGDGV